MTQHELLEEGIDLERGAARVQEIMSAKPERKQRSDAGAIYITPAKGVRLDISEPTGRAYLCDIMGRYAKAEYAEELASIGAQLLAIIERRK